MKSTEGHIFLTFPPTCVVMNVCTSIVLLVILAVFNKETVTNADYKPADVPTTKDDLASDEGNVSKLKKRLIPVRIPAAC